MTVLAHLQAQWDEEAVALAAVRRARRAMRYSRPALRPLLFALAIPAWLVIDRIIAGLAALSAGVVS